MSENDIKPGREMKPKSPKIENWCWSLGTLFFSLSNTLTHTHTGEDNKHTSENLQHLFGLLTGNKMKLLLIRDPTFTAKWNSQYW